MTDISTPSAGASPERTLLGSALWQDYRRLAALRDGAFTRPIDYREHSNDYYEYEQTDRHVARYTQIAGLIQQSVAKTACVLVDVGAGLGTLIEYLRKVDERAYRYYPIEVNEPGIDAMRSKLLEPIAANAWNLPFVDESVDILFAGELIEHLHFNQFTGFMSEVRRVVAANGLAIFTTPNWDSKPAREDRRNGLIPYSFDPGRNPFASEHVLPFTFESLGSVLEKFGFALHWRSTNQITHSIVPMRYEIFTGSSGAGREMEMGDTILMAAKKVG